MLDNCDDVIEIVKIIGSKKSKQLLPTINRLRMKSDIISISTALINPPVELEEIEAWIAKRVGMVDVLIPELNNLVLQYAGITYITYENVIDFINVNKLIIPYETKMKQIENQMKILENELKDKANLKRQLTVELYAKLNRGTQLI